MATTGADISNRDLLAVVLDEIALEGLDGITVDSLWMRLSVRMTPSAPTDPTFDLTSAAVQVFVFEHIVKSLTNDRTVSMYSLPQSRQPIRLYNRYESVNEETGTLIEDPDVIPDDVYGPVVAVTDQEVRGSSRDYYERQNVTKEVLNQNMSLQEVCLTYGAQRFVLVANQSQRTRALMGTYCDADIDLTAIQYCILERIGRHRFLGEITVGKESGDYSHSAKTLFYYRKVLLRKKLVRKKPCIVFNAKSVQNCHGLVFTLSRFATDAQTPTEMNAQKVSDLLATAPDGRLDYDFVRSQLVFSKARHFRDLMANYCGNFQVIHTDTESPAKEGNSSSAALKRTIRLIKPIGGGVEAVDDEEGGDEDDEEMTIGADKQQAFVVFSAGKILVDRPLMSQALAVIESHESQEGISLREVGHCLSLPKLEARSLVRYLEKVGAISTVMVDRGRQKVTLYIPKYRSGDADGVFSRARRSLSGDANSTANNLLNRANIILDCVQKQRLVDRIFTFKQLIRESERKNVHKVCTKTVVRVVHKLAADGLVRSIRTILRYQDQVKKLHFVCVPSITPDHPLVKERINQIKFQWIGKYCADIQSDRSFANTYSMAADKKSSSKSGKNNAVVNLVYQPSIARKYGLEPKLKKMLTLYRFLFYLTHDFDKQNVPNTDWRFNIDALPDGQTSKVCTIGDIIPRLPVSVFVRIIWISFIIPDLQELLDDPVATHLTLSQISPHLRQCLLYRRKFAFNICEALVGLSYMGLVETQYKEQTEKETTVITVRNKYSLIANNVQTDYEFNTMRELRRFEEDLEMHCFEPCDDCSLDKRLFAHNLRNWTYTPAYKTKSASASHRLQRLSGNNEAIEATSTTTGADAKENESQPKAKSSKKRKRDTNKTTGAKKKAKVSGQSSTPTTTNTTAATPTSSTSSTPMTPNATKRHRAYDKVDLRAKSLLKKQRTDWTPEEDSFLLVCKVASALLDPNCATHICVNRNVVRDELHKYYPHVSADKTALACQRRIIYMLKNPNTRQNVSDYIGEFNQELTITRPDVPKTHEQVWSEAYLQVLHQILARMQSSHTTTGNSQTVIAVHSMRDLLSRFKIIHSPTHLLPIRGPLHEDPHNVVDIHVNVVTNVLLSSLLSKHYMTANTAGASKPEANVFAQTLFRIYHRYPDSLIRSVATKLGKYGFMTKARKTIDLSTIKSKGSTPYRISQNFLFLLQTKYYLESLLSEQRLESDTICVKEGKTSFEAAIVSSLFASKAVRFYTHIPDNVVELQNDCPLYKTARNAVTNPKDPRTSSRYALHLLRQHMNTNQSDRTKHSADYLFVNQCRITSVATNDFDVDLQDFDRLFKAQQQLFANELNAVPLTDGSVTDRQLVAYIQSKRELGASEDELLCFQPKDSLLDSLSRLNERQLVFRVGVRRFAWVSVDWVQPWLVHSQVSPPAIQLAANTGAESQSVKYFARYWKQPNGTVDNKVVFKFLSGVLGHIMTNPCLPQQKLIEFFSQTLQPVQLLEIIELLKAALCVEAIESKRLLEPTLFAPKVQFSSDEKIIHFMEWYSSDWTQKRWSRGYRATSALRGKGVGVGQECWESRQSGRSVTTGLGVWTVRLSRGSEGTGGGGRCEKTSEEVIKE
ncbi:unnamed protein product [Oppiella nova]|uniref:B-block binding subunit of TFIIIC domain-containing protein n=1 Tax=Oppiella nova TaxID=334625 RepID=A0A7R9LI41_9ACAR|nr:unnamed protein product [Oppiella nova]CAG2163821.1 unnamed protein product [Oppiella nova]